MDHRRDDYAPSTADRSGLDPASACSRSAARLRPDPLNLNAITRLQALGQSVWLDASSPGALDFQRLRQLIDQDGISGIVCGTVHALRNDKRDKSTAARSGAVASARPANGLGTECRLTAQDAQAAADLLRARYVLTAGHDGLVSVNLASELEADAKQIVDDARRLWVAIARRNVLVSVPGSKANLPAIRDLVTAGLNIRVTTLYSGEQYSDAFDAYCAGLEARLAKGYPIWHIAFVVDFAVTALDRRINQAIQNLNAFASPCATSASGFAGEGGIASATVLHRRAIAYAASERFAALAKEGAQPPRLMWALGGGDTDQEIGKYVEALVRVGTVCCMPLAAIESYRRQDVSGEDRKPIPLERAFGTAMDIIIGLQKAGVDVGALARQLHAQDNIRHRSASSAARIGARGDDGIGSSMRKPPCRYELHGAACAYE